MKIVTRKNINMKFLLVQKLLFKEIIHFIGVINYYYKIIICNKQISFLIKKYLLI